MAAPAILAHCSAYLVAHRGVCASRLDRQHPCPNLQLLRDIAWKPLRIYSDARLLGSNCGSAAHWRDLSDDKVSRGTPGTLARSAEAARLLCTRAWGNCSAYPPAGEVI